MASIPVRVEVCQGRTMCDEDVSQRRNFGPDLVWWFGLRGGDERWADAGILEGPRSVFWCVWAAIDTELASAYGEVDG